MSTVGVPISKSGNPMAEVAVLSFSKSSPTEGNWLNSISNSCGNSAATVPSKFQFGPLPCCVITKKDRVSTIAKCVTPLASQEHDSLSDNQPRIQLQTGCEERGGAGSTRSTIGRRRGCSAALNSEFTGGTTGAEPVMSDGLSTCEGFTRVCLGLFQASRMRKLPEAETTLSPAVSSITPDRVPFAVKIIPGLTTG